jgi:hypothetical protein
MERGSNTGKKNSKCKPQSSSKKPKNNDFPSIKQLDVLAALLGVIGTAFIALSGVGSHKLPQIIAVFIGGVCLWAGGCLFWYAQEKKQDIPSESKKPQETQSATRAFSIITTWQESYGTKPEIWLLQDSVVRPIYHALMVNFTNLSNNPIMVDSYLIEQESKNGQWTVVSLPYGLSGGVIFTGHSLNKVRETNYTTLDSVIANKNINPHETVRGWVFLIKLITRESNGPLRFKMADALGNVSTEPMAAKANVGFPVQPPMVEILKDDRDISNIPMAK